jgi:hypothetical protein
MEKSVYLGICVVRNWEINEGIDPRRCNIGIDVALREEVSIRSLVRCVFRKIAAVLHRDIRICDFPFQFLLLCEGFMGLELTQYSSTNRTGKWPGSEKD